MRQETGEQTAENDQELIMDKDVAKSASRSSQVLRELSGLPESRLQLSKGPRNQRRQSMLVILRVAQ